MDKITIKLIKALKAIVDYVDKRKPTDFADAKHMLTLVGLTASTALDDAADDAVNLRTLV